MAGPVTAAAVILPPTYKHPLLNDSKKLTPKQRKEMRKEIEHVAISFAIAHVMPERIDEINILNASIEAMHLAIEKLDTTPAFILVDGNRFKPYLEIPHKCMIKGDARYLNIAAASVLAKTERDEFMTQLHSSLPHYHWDTNKGYPTKKHRKGIQSNGASKWHRKSFTLLPTQTQFDF
ncbi:MAG: ribonuclease HII [Flavobacteriaceae bacterium]|nr:MAG: ribonuclease HII [Flavobacteriaceae bacterium]